MAEFVFNISKGRFMEWVDLPETNDAFIGVLLQSTGLEADDVLVDYDDLAAILASTNTECDFTGYARFTLSGVAPLNPDTTDEAGFDADDPAPITNTGASSQASAALLICYDPDTTAGTDADIVPVTHHICVVTFEVDVPVQLSFSEAGVGAATDPAPA